MSGSTFLDNTTQPLETYYTSLEFDETLRNFVADANNERDKHVYIDAKGAIVEPPQIIAH